MKIEPGTSDTRPSDIEHSCSFRCYQKGHFDSYWVPTGHRGPARAGAVEETPVEVSSWDLVPVESVSKKTVDIQCACGDVVNYPVTEVSMKVGDYPSQCRQLCQIGYLFLC